MFETAIFGIGSFVERHFVTLTVIQVISILIAIASGYTAIYCF